MQSEQYWVIPRMDRVNCVEHVRNEIMAGKSHEYLRNTMFSEPCHHIKVIFSFVCIAGTDGIGNSAGYILSNMAFSSVWIRDEEILSSCLTGESRKDDKAVVRR